MTKQKEAAIRKVKACLAHADKERNANENERATALRQANALMEKYSIGIIDLGDTDELGAVGEGKISVGAKPWKADTVNAIAALYGCKVLYGFGNAYIYGRDHYRHVVEDMAGFVMDSIEKEAKSMKGDKTFKTSFRLGCSAGVWDQVNGILKERAKAHDGISASKALVLVDHFKNEMELAEAYIAEHIGKIGKGQQRKVKDHKGYRAGEEYGQSINLSDQLGDSSPKGRLT